MTSTPKTKPNKTTLLLLNSQSCTHHAGAYISELNPQSLSQEVLCCHFCQVSGHSIFFSCTVNYVLTLSIKQFQGNLQGKIRKNFYNLGCEYYCIFLCWEIKNLKLFAVEGHCWALYICLIYRNYVGVWNKWSFKDQINWFTWAWSQVSELCNALAISYQNILLENSDDMDELKKLHYSKHYFSLYIWSCSLLWVVLKDLAGSRVGGKKRVVNLPFVILSRFFFFWIMQVVKTVSM